MNDYILIDLHACSKILTFSFDRVQLTYADDIDDLPEWIVELMMLLSFSFSLNHSYILKIYRGIDGRQILTISVVVFVCVNVCNSISV